MKMTLVELITLLGSIGTFALALATFWNIFKPLKPKIKLSYGTTGEYLSTPYGQCGSVSPLGVSCRYFLYRLKVENRNKVTSYYAKKVYLRFIEISRLNNVKKWENLAPFNPFMMRWTSTTGNNDTFYNDLGKGEHLFTNFFTVKFTMEPMSDTEIHEIEIIPGNEGIENLALAAGFPREKIKQPGTFQFKIGVFGENMKPNEFIFKVTFNVDADHCQPKIYIYDT